MKLIKPLIVHEQVTELDNTRQIVQTPPSNVEVANKINEIISVLNNSSRNQFIQSLGTLKG